MLQTLYSLSDEQTEYQLKNRLSFMRFVRSGPARRGARRQDDLALSQAFAACRRLRTAVCRFDALLRAKGWLAMGGRSSMPR